VKLLLDMNLSPALADLLAEAGHDAAHWSAVGDRDETDRAIMAFARAGGREGAWS